jgi:hypothetical protein
MPDPVLWAFAPGGELTERLEWLTDVLAAWTGPEQRRRGRIGPRVFLGFEALESAGSRRKMEHLLVVNGAGEWLVPLWCDATQLTVPAGGGSLSTTLDAEILGRRFVVGANALLIGDSADAAQVSEVTGVSDYSIDIADLPNSWPVGTTLVPLVRARLQGMPELERFTADDVPATLAWRVLDPLDWPEDVGEATYRGLPVLEWRPDWTDDPAWQPERALDTVDAGSGPISVYDRAGIPLGLVVVPITLVGRDEIGAFRSLLYALAGRWGSLWVPTFAQDFKVAAALVAASSTLDVEDIGFSAWDLQANRRDLRIELANGTVLYRRITAATAIAGNKERLTLDSALGVSAAACAVRSVSFLQLSRQDADVNLLRYWKSDVVTTELRIRAELDDDV